jgi:hypothetical protein
MAEPKKLRLPEVFASHRRRHTKATVQFIGLANSRYRYAYVPTLATAVRR